MYNGRMKKKIISLFILLFLLSSCGQPEQQANVRIVGVVNKQTRQALSGAAITLRWEYPDGGGRKESYTDKDLPLSVKLPVDRRYKLTVKAQAEGYQDFELIVKPKTEELLDIMIEMEAGTSSAPTPLPPGG